LKRTLILTLALALAGIFSSPARLAADDAEKKSLTRSEDPIVIKAEGLEGMAGAKIDMLALFAYNDGFSPVPFQVDEVTKEGGYVYTEGPDKNPEDGDGLANGQDELVFMAWDLADRAPEDAAMPCAPEKSAEIEIEDPQGGGKGWAYLALCSEDPPLSETDYVWDEYDGVHDWVKTGRYHFAEKRGESYFDRLAIEGPDGKVGDNLVDRIKGRGTMSAAMGMIDIETPESDLKGSIRAWIDGPVRVIHLMTAYLKFSVIKLNLGGQSQNLFYPNYYVTPIQVNTPINPGTVLTSFKMRYAIDWLEGFEGTSYYDPVNTEGVVIDGKMSEAEKNLDYETHHEWYALGGPHGNFMVRMILPDQWRGIVPQKLYYVDDVTEEDPPESDPGQRCAGFMLDAMADIPAGNYQYNLYYMVPPGPPPASVPQMLAIIDHPLEVDVEDMD